MKQVGRQKIFFSIQFNLSSFFFFFFLFSNFSVFLQAKEAQLIIYNNSKFGVRCTYFLYNFCFIKNKIFCIFFFVKGFIKDSIKIIENSNCIDNIITSFSCFYIFFFYFLPTFFLYIIICVTFKYIAQKASVVFFTAILESVDQKTINRR